MSDLSADRAVLFPGQGVGDPSSRELVERCSPRPARAGDRIWSARTPSSACRKAPPTRSPPSTAPRSPAIEQLGRPAADYFAGHSLGEIGALAAAGAIDDADGLRIVVARGRVMDDAAGAGEPGGMLAVGSRPWAGRGAGPSARPDAGQRELPAAVRPLRAAWRAIEAAEAAAKGSGVRAKKLAVAGAFHTEAMASASSPSARRSAEIDFREPAAPVVSSTTADFFGERRRATRSPPR